MISSVRMVKQGLTRWVAMDPAAGPADVAERCTAEALQKALAHLRDVTVASVTVNTSGQFEAPPLAMMAGAASDPQSITGLPDFIDVRVRKVTPGGHVAEIVVWVPLDWNGRFFGTGGFGMRTANLWLDVQWTRVPALPVALRNGFATATTDAGIRDARDWAYALDEDTREVDWELIRNWAYRATHEMTLVGKVVTQAIHGTPPRYSYLAGSSGGGRQALAEAQRYPEDYDGIWAAEPAVNWTKFVPAEIWPPLVMKEHNNPVPPAKLEAFRAAAIAACDGADGLVDGLLEVHEMSDYDPKQLVGTRTSAGEITAADADVVQKIWQGPRTASGEFLWYGLRPDTESWGQNVLQTGLALTTEVDGELAPVPFTIAADWIGAYLLRDPQWDWTALTFERFEELFARSVRDFAECDTGDPDLSGFREHGGKLIITHATGDEVIPCQGTIDYYHRVQEAMGGERPTAEFVRLFVSSGPGHSHIVGNGPGPTIAGTMLALMEWVEHGTAPDTILGERFDLATNQVTMTRPVCAYPASPRYRGEGDPDDVGSFTCQRPS